MAAQRPRLRVARAGLSSAPRVRAAPGRRFERAWWRPRRLHGQRLRKGLGPPSPMRPESVRSPFSWLPPLPSTTAIPDLCCAGHRVRCGSRRGGHAAKAPCRGCGRGQGLTIAMKDTLAHRAGFVLQPDARWEAIGRIHHLIAGDPGLLHGVLHDQGCCAGRGRRNRSAPASAAPVWPRVGHGILPARFRIDGHRCP